MVFVKRDIVSSVILTCGIGICSLIGDQGLNYGKTPWLRAIFDNVTHAIVGGLTWTLILHLSRKSLVQNFSSIFWCFFLSSFIDVDHFIAACSWKLNEVDELVLYFAIACGIAGGAFIVIFILMCGLYAKVRRLASNGSNQLNKQSSMMADFCYTNPTIVPGELLSRRGFSMYSGSEAFNENYTTKSKDHYGTYQEGRSKF
ncbi:uncharacterized protein LOC128874817 isoform X3 [Hylaeus volcanicus]|uniref:uncharacterized protein LOC128874817 isoform X3 n=1 Tax=Hylaeus volcanicus TaxID=313075 RepID=UPI0023B781DD|nr:uncharacterized protein LOC128874817 isoform X3 [Hylaeus volcanicus]